MNPEEQVRMIRRLRDRKVVQWTLAYLAAAWAVLQVVDLFSDRFAWPTVIFRTTAVLVGTGVFAALIIAWYHGERGKQRATGPELIMLACVLFAGGVLAALIGPDRKASAGPRQAEDSRYALPQDSAPAAVAAQASRIAVFPFRVTAIEDSAGLREGLMDLLSESIDGVGDIRRVDPLALMSRVRRSEQPSLIPEDPLLARGIALQLGAGRFILSSLSARGDSVSIRASLYEVGRDEATAFGLVRGEPARLARLVQELARQLLTTIPLGDGARLERNESIHTDSYDALKSYLAGEALIRRGRFDSAGVKLREAIAADSGFALAWLRLAIAQGWGAGCCSPQSIAYARRFRHRLATRDQLLTDAQHAAISGDGVLADSIARNLVRRYPDHVDGWYLLAVIRWSYRWRLAASLDELRAVIDRGLALDPHYPPLVSYAVDAAIVQRRYEDAKRLLAIAPEIGPRDTARFAGSLRFANKVVLAHLAGTDSDRKRAAEVIENAADEWVHATAGYMLLTDSLHAAEPLLRQLVTGVHRTDWSRRTGAFHLALLELARGRWRAGDEAFSFLRKSVPDALATQAIIASLPIYQRPQQELDELRRTLVAWQPPSAEHAVEVGHANIPPSLLPWVRDYALGLLSARLNDSVAAATHAAVLEQAIAPADPTGLRRELAAEIRALIALEQRRPQLALALLGERPGRLAEQFDDKPLNRRPIGRFLRAQSLLDLKQYEQAAAWFSSFEAQFASWDYVLLAPAYLRLAMIHEQRGEAVAAADHYSRFIARWRTPDVQYEPVVEQARRRLATLRRGAR